MNEVKVFVAQDYFSKNEFETYVEQNNGGSIVLWAPETITVPQLFANKSQYEDFKTYLENNSMEWKIVSGALDNSFYGDDDRILYWSDYHFYDIANRIVKNGMRMTVYPSLDSVEMPFQMSKLDYFNAYSFVFIDTLAQYGLLDKGLLTINDGGDIPVSDRYELQYWTPEIIENKFTAGKNYSRYVDNANLFKASLFEFNVSITDDYPIVRGEMAYAFLTGRFPLCYTGQHTYKILTEKFGLNLLENLICYDFDNIEKEDPYSRLDLVVKEMAKLCDKFDSEKKNLANELIPASAINIQKVIDVIAKCNIDSRIVEIMNETDMLSYYKSLLTTTSSLAVIGKRVYVTQNI